ncbi:MBL fold metallo-hydrolase [Cellulosimicrobium funkei]
MVAPVFGTNCTVVSAPGGDCVVVDAGAGVAVAVVAHVRSAGLVPRAVLATHGHVDHTWDAAALADRFGVPVVLHAADAYRLAVGRAYVRRIAEDVSEVVPELVQLDDWERLGTD